MSSHIAEDIVVALHSPAYELASLLTRAAESSRQELLRLYCDAETANLKQRAEECYQYVHWIWHHCPCFSSFQETASSPPPPSSNVSLRASNTDVVIERCLQAVTFDAANHADAIQALKRVAHVLLECIPSSESDNFERLRACTINCEQFQFIQTKLAKLRDLQAKAEASAAHATSTADSNVNNLSTSNHHEGSNDRTNKARSTHPPALAAEFRSLPSCNSYSCHQQLPRDATTPSSGSSATEGRFEPFLMMLHSVFLLRFFFYYAFHEHSLIQSSESKPVTPTCASDPVSTPFIIQPKLSTFCHAFSQWPPPLHAAVHTFADNLQFCSYAHMIVALRGQGGGADSVIASPPSSASSSVPSTQPQYYQLDTRFWRRVLFDLKQKAEFITSEELRKVLQQMNLASHSTYLVSPHNSFSLPSPSVSPSLHDLLEQSRTPRILHVVGDSHSLSLHTQWLFCLLQQRQQFRWMQMQSHIIIGLKAFHVGQLLAQPASTLVELADVASSGASLQTRTLLAYSHRVPPGSDVLLVAGEIDCRTDEGLLQAVEKGKYPSVKDAIQSTIKGYLEGLQRLAHAHKWRRILFHPVCAPYLAGNKIRMVKKGWKDLKEEGRRQQHTTAAASECKVADDTVKVPSLLSRVHTRALLIRDFNAELKKQIEALNSHKSSSSCFADSGCAFHLLDFYPDLCTTPPDTASMENPPLLRADFTLEGMHLNTKYTPLIERELEKILDS